MQGVLLAGSWRIAGGGKPGEIQRRVNNPLSMLKLRCNNKIELNSNSFGAAAPVRTVAHPPRWGANAVSRARGSPVRPGGPGQKGRGCTPCALPDAQSKRA